MTTLGEPHSLIVVLKRDERPAPLRVTEGRNVPRLGTGLAGKISARANLALTLPLPLRLLPHLGHAKR